MAKTPAEKVRETEARKRAAGMHEVRIWVPSDRADELRTIAATMREENKKKRAASQQEEPKP